MTATTVLGTCHHDCPDSCGWVATVENSVAVKLRGNPDHPFSRGELCPKVNRFIDRVYSPERLLQPLLRVGTKGEGRFEETTWETALAVVAERVAGVIDEWGGEAVLPWWDAGTQGLIQMSSLDRRFFARLGSTRLVGSLCGGTANAGTATTLGDAKACDPADLRFADLVLLWGTNTKLTNRHLWPFVEEARSNGAKVVVIDPLRTMTAGEADWFLQPLPGTDVALMLAIMHVLVRDDLIDTDYVQAHTTGFNKLADRVSEWTPARAGEICGIAPADIEALATEYGTTPRAFIRTLIGAEHHEQGAMFFRALSCLPCLTGSWRHRGGGLARSVGTWFDVNVDDTVFDAPHLAGGVERRSVNMNHLGRALTDPAMDPPVRSLFVWNGNPAVTVPSADLIRRGLERDDLFTVVSEQFLTDTARYADVIFPAATQLEQLDVVPAWGHLYLGWNEPAIQPLGEAVPNTELWRRLASAMGFDEPEFHESDESLIDAALVDVDIEHLRKTGFLRLDLPEDLRPYENGGFNSGDGRAQLYSESLAAEGLDPLPGYAPPKERDLAAEFPLVMLTPKQHTRFLNSSYSHLPKHGPAEGGPFVELCAADAAVRAIEEGTTVRVFNGRGSMDLPARISDRLRPGVVAVPFGWWGNDAANRLTSDTLTDWGGGVAYCDTQVEVSAIAAP